MDKELEEKMDKLLDSLDINLDKIKDEVLNTPCKIHIDNNGKTTSVAVKGGRLSLLSTLAGAEKDILKQLNCGTGEFEFIKNMVSFEEAENE